MVRKLYKYHYIYKTVNQLNGQYYIGMHSTDNLEDEYLGSGQRLWHAIKKYGRENFKKEILDFFPDRKMLGLREKEIVNKEIVADPLCMNLKLGGEYSPGTFGKKYSEESRKKMSEWKRTEETKKKISESHIGLQPTLETKHKMSQSAKKRTSINGMKGRKHTDDAIFKIKEKLQNRIITEETKRKISEAHKGIIHSEETKRKISEAHRGVKRKPHSDETKRKMSEAHRGVKRKPHSDETKRKMSEVKQKLKF